MLEYLEGEVIELTPTSVVLEIKHVGYRLEISLFTYEEIQSKKSVKLFTHLYVRNEGQNVSGFELFGFASKEERLYFTTVIGVSGIGTATARLMLSAMKPNEINQAILHEDVNAFTSVKGIGPKTAKRLILELKDKIPQVSELISLENNNSSSSYNTMVVEALSALEMLGFSKQVAKKAMDNVMKNNSINSVEELVKESLKKL